MKSISPRALPGVQELQRRDLLHRATDLVFEDHITEDEEDEAEKGGTKYLPISMCCKTTRVCIIKWICRLFLCNSSTFGTFSEVKSLNLFLKKRLF